MLTKPLSLFQVGKILSSPCDNIRVAESVFAAIIYCSNTKGSITAPYFFGVEPVLNSAETIVKDQTWEGEEDEDDIDATKDALWLDNAKEFSEVQAIKSWIKECKDVQFFRDKLPKLFIGYKEIIRELIMEYHAPKRKELK